MSHELRDEFERTRKKEGTFDTTSEFVASAMTAYVLQVRRGEQPAYPLEFRIATPPRPKGGKLKTRSILSRSG